MKVQAVCARVQVESCDGLNLLLNERLLTGTAELFHCPAVLVGVMQPLGTLQVRPQTSDKPSFMLNTTHTYAQHKIHKY